MSAPALLGPACAQRLSEGADALGLSLSAEAHARLLAFGALLLKWNRVYNLTAIRSPEEVVTHHLLDALSVIPHLCPFEGLLDVGSGAGIPGLVLALTHPDWPIASVDAVQKKISFQQQVCIALKPPRFVPLHGRVERLKPPFPVDALISRAFASLNDFVELAGGLLPVGGRLYAMKGQRPDEELASLPAGWALEMVRPLNVPGLNAQRHLVVLSRTGSGEAVRVR
jgi:16S rRNA (guanine527-N7)-methyltransferase